MKTNLSNFPSLSLLEDTLKTLKEIYSIYNVTINNQRLVWLKKGIAVIEDEVKKRQVFEALIRSRLELHELAFNTNPHDEYFSYHHGAIDAIKEILGE